MENSVNEIDVATLAQWFSASEDSSIAARQEAERSRDYVDGKQLTEAERSTLKKRGQPPVVINRIRRKVEWLLGLEVKQRTDPKAFPRTQEHQQGAEAVTDAIRYVCDAQDWDHTRSNVYDNMLIEGFGGVEVVHKQNTKGEVDVVINHYPWDRLFYDPHSRKSDFSDARYKGVVLWMDQADFEAVYSDEKAAVAGLFTGANDSSTYDDKPNSIWADPKRKRVRVVLMWFKQGNDWHWCKFIKDKKLDQGVSPYKDEDGSTVCPLLLQSAYIGRDNNRYGIIRDMIDPQDEINKRRSKSLHLLNSRQVKMSKGVADKQTVQRELANPQGVIELEMGPDDVFEILGNNDLTSGQMALLQEAKSEIDLMGANSALSGDTGESTSGRAVLARQQGGMIEVASFTDKLHRFTREVYRHIWQRIRQFWTEERWVRITDDEKNVRFVGFNRPVKLGEALGNMPEEQAMQIAMEMGLGPNDPRLEQIVKIDNVAEEIDVDIVIEEVPDRVTLQGEMFEALTKYAMSGAIPPEVLIEADPVLPTKKKEKLLRMMQERQPGPKEQIEMAGKEAEVQKTQAEAAKIAQEAQMPLAGIAAQ